MAQRFEDVVSINRFKRADNCNFRFVVLRNYPYPVLFFRLYRKAINTPVIISCYPLMVFWNADFHTEVFNFPQ